MTIKSLKTEICSAVVWANFFALMSTTIERSCYESFILLSVIKVDKRIKNGLQD